MRKKAAGGGPDMPTPEPGPVWDVPPRKALMRVNHYVGNYLSIVDAIAELLYAVLNGDTDADLQINSGRTLGAGLGVNEEDVLRTLGARYDVNAEEFPWDLLKQLMVRQGVADFAADLVLLQLQTIFLEANDFMAAKLALLEFGLTMVEHNQISLNDFVEVFVVFADILDAVTDVLEFEIPNIQRERIDLGESSWFLVIDGRYTIDLPEDSTELFYWELSPSRGMRLRMRAPTATLLGDSSLYFLHESKKKPGKFIRIPIDLLSSFGDISLENIELRLTAEPTLGRGHAEDFGPGHLFREAQFVRDTEGASTLTFSLTVDGADVNLRNTPLTVTLAAPFGGMGNLEDFLERGIVWGINQVGEFAGLGAKWDEEISPRVERLVPNALGASRARVRTPPLEGGQLDILFEDLKTEANRSHLAIFNEYREPSDGDGGGDGGGPGFPDDDFPDFPETDWMDSRASNAGGGIRSLSGADRRLLGRRAEKKIMRRLQPRQLAKFELAGQRRDQAGHRVSPLLRVLLTGLKTGMGLNEIALLRWHDFDLRAGTLRGKELPPDVVEPLRLMQRAADSTQGFVFDSGNGLPDVGIVLRVLAGLEVENRLPVGLTFPAKPGACDYRTSSPLEGVWGDRADPAWVGLSFNCVVPESLYEELHQRGHFEVSGNLEIDGVAYGYAIETTGFVVDFSGRNLPDERPALNLRGTKVTVVRDGGQPVVFKGYARLPLRPVRYAEGCLPDEVVTGVITNLDCIEELTGGNIGDQELLHDLLYRHFVFLIVDPKAGTGHELSNASVQEGNESDLGTGDVAALLSSLLLAAYAQVTPIPVLYHPYWFLNPVQDSYRATEGWLLIYDRYELGFG